jgi:hypothetical protein
MNRKLLLIAAGIISVPIIWMGLAISSPPTDVPDLSKITRMTDNRDPMTITGSVWTQNLDCTYRDPPSEWILRMGGLGCQEAEHNLEVLTTKRDYFVPRSTGSDNAPPYCLVKGPANKSKLASAKEYVRLKCK